jgi:hypothetical protein
MLSVVAVPAVALAQVDPTAVPDPLSLVTQFFNAVQGAQWLAAILPGTLLLIWLLRTFAGKFLPWLTTDQGGAVLGLAAAVISAVVASLALPGPHSLLAVVVASVTTLVANNTVFILLKKVFPGLAVFPTPAASAPTPAPAVPSSSQPAQP